MTMGALSDYLAAEIRERLHPADCHCPACWCLICGHPPASFVNDTGEHVCPPSLVSDGPKGIGPGGHSWDDLAVLVGWDDS